MTKNEITAEVYTTKDNVYHVKVFLCELGMYISGITVRISPKYKDWWVQMPYYWNPSTKGAKRYVEYSSESTIKTLIEQKCIDAVEEIGGSLNRTSDVIVDPSDDVLNKPLDLSSIPF